MTKDRDLCLMSSVALFSLPPPLPLFLSLTDGQVYDSARLRPLQVITDKVFSVLQKSQAVLCLILPLAVTSLMIIHSDEFAMSVFSLIHTAYYKVFGLNHHW